MQKNINVPVITIDGPGGTGKGTICHMLAHKLGWHCLDSGAIYRVFAYAAMQQNLALKDLDKLVILARQLPLSFDTDASHGHQVKLHRENVTKAIRTEHCGQMASTFAAIPELRQALLQRQRDFAVMPGLVTDGRDMGTVVFPEAGLKIFLTASKMERAQRRFLQLQAQGIDMPLETVMAELQRRDERDSQRQASPLKPAVDAIEMDTSDKSVIEVFELVYHLAKNTFALD
jgi:CMP/dCMP kinase